MRRVGITGIGLVTPLGVGTEETWHGLLDGRSAVDVIRSYDASSLGTRLGAEIAEFQPKDFVDKKQRRSLRMMTRTDALGVVAAILAVRDSGLEMTEEVAEDTALFLGSNKEICTPEHLLTAALTARDEDGSVDMRRFGEMAPSAVYPLFYIEGLQAANLFYISEAFGLKGPNTFFAGTAETGATAVGRAYRAIARGEAEVAIAGGYDDPVSWWSMTKLDPMGVLTRRNDLGAGACRPYDRDRDGAVMGEGAALLVLEELEAARARGARVYAEIDGFGTGKDTNNLITPDPRARGLRLALERALKESGNSDRVDYVALHGSGTRRGDLTEAVALRAEVAHNGDAPAASSVKPATGDLMAAAGALNVAVAALAVHGGRLPPTLNLEHPDPGCEGADWVLGEAREGVVRRALAIARGLEGQNVVLALRAAH